MTDPAGPGTTTIMLTPPGETEQHSIELNLYGFTLAERNVAKKALAQLADPDVLEIVAVNAWVVWKRTHPECKLDDWFNGITFGDMLGQSLQDVLAEPLATPDGYDPEV